MEKVVVFDTHGFERDLLQQAHQRSSLREKIRLEFIPTRLTEQTVGCAQGAKAVAVFANDKLSKQCLKSLSELGVRFVALRCAGFNQVDLKTAQDLGMRVSRVPAYSPHSVAEHAVALILSLNRQIPKAFARVKELNFSLDGLVGFDLYRKTVGVVGTGKIGEAFCRILHGFGTRILAYDISPNQNLSQELGVEYVSLAELFSQSDIISLHCPLNEKTRHLINKDTIEKMKSGVMLINTGRGALIDTVALVRALKSRKIGFAGLDVYEEEENVFFRDLSEEGLQDDQLARLLTFPHVLITAHQAFLTKEALDGIARTTLQNLEEYFSNKPLSNEVRFLKE